MKNLKMTHPRPSPSSSILSYRCASLGLGICLLGISACDQRVADSTPPAPAPKAVEQPVAESAPPTPPPVKANKFEKLDADKNGAVALEEYKARSKKPDADARFAKIDADKNGTVSLEEWSGTAAKTEEPAAEGPSAPAANHLPKFSWDRVPLYMHIRKARKFSKDEIKYLATFPLVTFEKTTGSQTFKSTEDGTLAAAKAVKKINPSTKILYYRNVIMNWPTYKVNAEFDKIPGAFLVGKNGKTKLNFGKTDSYDLTNPQVREVWVGNVKQMCADPAIDGVFFDAVCKAMGPTYLAKDIGEEKKAALVEGYKTMMTETRQAIGPDKIMLANVLRVGTPDNGLEAIKQFDGSYLERIEEARTGDKAAKRNYLAQGIETFQKAAREGYMIAMTLPLGEINTEAGEGDVENMDEISKPVGENEDYNKRFNYILSLFLICAEKHSYFLAKDGYNADKSKVWMKRPAEFDRPLGPPKGPAVQDGYIYTREFAHAKVRLDIDNQVGEIEWIEPEKN